MKFDVDDKNRCRLVYVKFHLNRCRFAVIVAKCLGGSLFWDTVYIVAGQWATVSPSIVRRRLNDAKTSAVERMSATEWRQSQ